MYTIKHNEPKEKSSLHPFYNKELIEDEETPRILACDDLISFIIGGTQFQILKSKFAYWPKTRLSRLIRAKTKKETLRLCNNFVCEQSGQTKKYIFLRNGNNFNSILDTCYFCIKPVSHNYFNQLLLSFNFFYIFT